MEKEAPSMMCLYCVAKKFMISVLLNGHLLNHNNNFNNNCNNNSSSNCNNNNNCHNWGESFEIGKACKSKVFPSFSKKIII
jgi:hypothetical protein